VEGVAIAGGYAEYSKVSVFSVVSSAKVLIDEIQCRPGIILLGTRHQLAYVLADERDGPICSPSIVLCCSS